jgi:excisionase family DNA binding protein
MSETAMERRFLSYVQASEYTSVSMASLRRAVQRRELRVYRPSVGRVLFDVRELDAWVHAHPDADSDLQEITDG